MSDRMFNVGLLGAGYIADWHAKALRHARGAQLAAICDTAPGRAEALAHKFGAASAYTSLKDMIRDGNVSAVHVLLPPDRHVDAAKELLEAGMHVFLEKPMCAHSADCARLVELAQQKNLTLAVAHNFLFFEAYETLRRDVRSGLLGKLDHVTINWHKELGQLLNGPFDTWMLRSPENLMVEIGPHSVSVMRDLLGEPGEMRVHAGNAILLPTGVSALRRWQVACECDGVAVTMNFSFVPGFAEHSIQVRGSLGVATVDFERNTYVLLRHTEADVDPDRRAISMRAARSLSRQGNRNFARFVLSKFGLSRRGNAYGASISGAVRAFYDGIGSGLDDRISANSGTRAIELCEQIGKQGCISAGVSFGLNGHAHPAAESRSAIHIATNIAPKVLVLGATGFIGVELVRQLLAAGHAVRVLARSPAKLPADLRTESVQVIRGDLSNGTDLSRAIEGVETVYHLARAHVKTWSDYQNQEIDVTRRIAEQCLASGAKRLIYTGTIDSYYAGTRSEVITERTPLDPKIEGRNLYARAKAASEVMLLQMHRENHLPVVIVRPGIVIGRGGSPLHWGVGMWQHNAVCRMWGNGTNPLPLVLVEDVASALVLALSAPGIDGESFNLVSPTTLSACEYLAELERCARIKLHRPATAIRRFFLSDVAKWIVKTLVRHPERRVPSYRDWQSRTQKATFDCRKAVGRLGWKPAAKREDVIRKGIEIPAEQFLN